MNSRISAVQMKALLMSPLWVMALITLMGMDCSGGVSRIDEASYVTDIRLAKDNNGKILIGYRYLRQRDVVVQYFGGGLTPEGESYEDGPVVQLEFDSLMYDFATAQRENAATIATFDPEEDYPQGFRMTMGDTGSAAASWFNQGALYGAGYTIRQPTLNWLPAEPLDAGQDNNFRLVYDQVADNQANSILVGLAEDDRVYTRGYRGSTQQWDAPLFQPVVNRQPGDLMFDMHVDGHLLWTLAEPSTSLYATHYAPPANPLAQPVATSSSHIHIRDLVVARGNNPYAMVIWNDDNGMYSNFFDGNSWGQAMPISALISNVARAVQLGMDASGNAVLVWKPGYDVDGDIRVIHFSPQSGWMNEQVLGQGRDPVLDVNVNGEAILVWHRSVSDEPGNRLYAARYSVQNGWMQEGVIARNASSEYRVLIDNNGNGLAAWSRLVDTTNGVYAFGTRLALYDFNFTGLDVTVNGDGRVTSSPQGIDCGTGCSDSYPRNSTVTLTAVPDSGATFIGWGGDCTPLQTIADQASVMMDSARSCSANFSSLSLQNYTLTLNILGGPGAGEVNSQETPVPLLNCINSNEAQTQCTASYQAGSQVYLSPTPYSGNFNISWTGCDSEAGIEGCSIIMNSNRTVSVTF